LIVGVDTRNGFVATHGWEQTSTREALAFCKTLADVGVVRILFTDIGRDGMLEGPNLDAIREMIESTPLRVIASGGVSSADDLRRLDEVGAESAIIGKALYDGRLTLSDALALAR
jgi:phosphoribosylformimino-5-aminoimidazole carboxamide ribotide isomerase